MGDHSEGMDPGVGAARTVDARYVRKKFLEGFLDFLLDAGADFLSLPALIPRAVVSNGKFNFLCFHNPHQR